MLLGTLRRGTGVSLATTAARMGLSPGALEALEGEPAAELSVGIVSRYVTALGGRLVAHVPAEGADRLAGVRLR